MLEELIKAAIQQYLQSDDFQALVEAAAQDKIERYMEFEGYKHIASQIENTIESISVSLSVN